MKTGNNLALVTFCAILTFLNKRMNMDLMLLQAGDAKYYSIFRTIIT